MDSVFFQSMLVRPPEILGRQLHHFSAWHTLLLTWLDNAFIEGGEVAEGDITEFVYICGTQYKEGDLGIMDPNVARYAYKWGKEIGTFDYNEVIAQIDVYLTDYMSFPKFWYREFKTKESHIPVSFRIVATVLSNYSTFSEEEAWNMPMIKAACYRACVAEDNGQELVGPLAKSIFKDLEEKNMLWKAPPITTVN